jgi:hypothetical protein
MSLELDFNGWQRFDGRDIDRRWQKKLKAAYHRRRA